ncbi:hypothetical protein Rsub_11995 [Raphidocelis subcapitata]|uniref:Selenoprotein F n=1 Tax=Raphidocelis subcapitata TaxID=307507 RepID=A0A2V0PMD8_9CHLO|nr:hypothetical protein Rsub_11995 [Raphidocelis subcapitata]|eukprot:GBF99050.1 hypothetical protein Rsub_11995 [Raphidocelis subcapitata]
MESPTSTGCRRRPLRQQLLFLLLAACAACSVASAAAAAAAAGGADCEAKGFAAPSCADCDVFSEIVKDAALAADCKACCTPDEVAVKFSKALLEVCPYRVKSGGQIADFIKKHAKQFGAQLSVRERPGAYPRLVLTGGGEGGGERSAVRIDNWKAATLVEYLRERLAPAGGGGGGGGGGGNGGGKGGGKGGSKGGGKPAAA